MVSVTHHLKCTIRFLSYFIKSSLIIPRLRDKDIWNLLILYKIFLTLDILSILLEILCCRDPKRTEKSRDNNRDVNMS